MLQRVGGAEHARRGDVVAAGRRDPSASAIARATSAPLPAADSSTSHAPSGTASSIARATSSASRVLPAAAGPTMRCR